MRHLAELAPDFEGALAVKTANGDADGDDFILTTINARKRRPHQADIDTGVNGSSGGHDYYGFQEHSGTNLVYDKDVNGSLHFERVWSVIIDGVEYENTFGAIIGNQPFPYIGNNVWRFTVTADFDADFNYEYTKHFDATPYGSKLDIRSDNFHVIVNDWSNGEMRITLSGGVLDLGDETITANDSGDTLTSGIGDDMLVGGSGSDQFSFYGAHGQDSASVGEAVVFDDVAFAGEAQLNEGGGSYALGGRTLTLTPEGLLIDDGAGNTLLLQDWDAATNHYGITLQEPAVVDEVINGTEADEVLDGGDGNDTIDGFAGNDTLIGGAGDDQLVDNIGSDSLAGGDGVDTIQFFGNAGDDTVTGGEVLKLVAAQLSGGYSFVANDNNPMPYMARVA